MSLVDEINERLRDFETWNSQYPLPIGNPRSGVKNIDIADLRALLLLIAQTVGDPDALQSILDDMLGLANAGGMLSFSATSTGVNAIGGSLSTVAQQVALTPGVRIGFISPATSDGRPITIEVGALGALPLYDRADAVLPAGALLSGRYYEARLTGSGGAARWRLSFDDRGTDVAAELAYRATLWTFDIDNAPDPMPVIVSEDLRVVADASASAARSGTTTLITDDGQSNAEGQAGSAVGLYYGSTPNASLLTVTRGAAADPWLGIVTSGGASVELLAGDLTGVGPMQPQLSAVGTHGTLASEGAARALLAAADRRVMVWSNAEGGQSIDNLLPTAGAGYFGYANAVTAIQRAAALHGPGLVWRWQIMAQGESDTSVADLGARHDAYRAALSDAARTATGQAEAVRMISFQMSSFSTSTGARAILQHALDNADDALFFCGGPTYWLPFSDDFLHNSSVGQGLRGEYAAAMMREVDQTGQSLPLHIVSARITGANQITLTLSEPAVIETNATVAAIANHGLTMTGGTISAVAVDGDQIVLTTGAAASTSMVVQAGLTGQANPRTAAAIPRTNIRSARGYGAFLAGGTIRKWLSHQSIGVTA